MKVMLDLPHDYEVMVDTELPPGNSPAVFEFQPPDRAAAGMRCLVTFRSRGSGEWTGRFVGDYDEPPAMSVVCSGATPNRVFVVCRGRAYHVDVTKPEWVEVVPCFPVCSMRIVASPPVIVFGNFTDVIAYGSEGVLWQANSLVSDDLVITAANEDMVTVEGLDAAFGKTKHAALNLRTGISG